MSKTRSFLPVHLTIGEYRIQEMEDTYKNLALTPDDPKFVENFEKMIELLFFMVLQSLIIRKTFKATKFLQMAMIAMTHFPQIKIEFGNRLENIKKELRTMDQNDRSVQYFEKLLSCINKNDYRPLPVVLEADESNPHIAAYIALKEKYEKADREDLAFLELNCIIDELEPVAQKKRDPTALAYLFSERALFYYRYNHPSYAMATILVASDYYEFKKLKKTFTAAEANNYIKLLYVHGSYYADLLNLPLREHENPDKSLEKTLTSNLRDIYKKISALHAEGYPMPTSDDTNFYFRLVSVPSVVMRKALEEENYKTALECIIHFETLLKSNQSVCRMVLPASRILYLEAIQTLNPYVKEFLKIYERMQAKHTAVTTKIQKFTESLTSSDESKPSPEDEKQNQSFAKLFAEKEEIQQALDRAKQHLKEAEETLASCQPYYKNKDDAKKKLADLKSLLADLHSQYIKVERNFNQAVTTHKIDDTVKTTLATLQTEISDASEKIKTKLESLIRNKQGNEKGQAAKEEKRQKEFLKKQEENRIAEENKKRLEATRIEAAKLRNEEKKKQAAIDACVQPLVNNILTSFANKGMILPFFAYPKERIPTAIKPCQESGNIKKY